MHLDGVAVGADAVLGDVDDGADDRRLDHRPGRRRAVRDAGRRVRGARCGSPPRTCPSASSSARKIGTFQAVAQRVADAYIDTEAIRLTAQQAAWRLAEGLPPPRTLAIAKFWAADGGQRVVHAAQHLHGGIGVDLDYPVHRYFRWAKEIELTLGRRPSTSLPPRRQRIAAAPAG